MKRKCLILVSLLLVCCMLPLNAMAGLYWGQIVRITANSSVNVYAQPERKNFIGEAMSTNTYDYLGRSGDWYHIQFTSDKDGYIPAKYAEVEDGLIWRSGAGEVEAVVRNTHYNALNVRKGPSLKTGVLGEMKPDTCLEYCGTENGWNRVLYKGEYAYVAGNRTTIEVTGGADATGGATGGSAQNCSVCNGSRTCITCDGKGYVYSNMAKDNVDCPSCSGLGVCYACYDNR